MIALDEFRVCRLSSGNVSQLRNDSLYGLASNEKKSCVENRTATKDNGILCCRPAAGHMAKESHGSARSAWIEF